jgi:protein transport protein HofQ
MLAADQPTVTLDVKDADVREILRSMQKQCGIKNLVIDPDVSGAGTIYFHDVPCETAFETVFKQFGLKGEVEPNMVVVEPRPH